MSEDTKQLYAAKIAAEFELFEERKENYPDQAKDLESKVKEINEKLGQHEPVSKEAAAELYNAYANSRRYEIREGFFRERKKCHYCVCLANFDMHSKAESPCKKLNAWTKLRESYKDFNEADQKDFEKGHLDCEDNYLPILDECDVRADLQALERKQLGLIAEWETDALEQIKNQN